VAGLAKVSKVGIVDETQFDPKSEYYDEKSTREKPRWDCVEVEYVRTLPNPVVLERIRGEKKLANMVLLKQGRLSVQPVEQAEYEHIVALAETSWEPPAKPRPVAKKKKENKENKEKKKPKPVAKKKSK
jgi:predicted RNA-binding protein with PUA-like domain